MDNSSSRDDRIYECCACSANKSLAEEATLLERRTCPVHGEMWHVLMKRAADGSLEITYPRSYEMPVCELSH